MSKSMRSLNPWFQSMFGDSPVDWQRYYGYIRWPDLTLRYVGNEWAKWGWSEPPSSMCHVCIYRAPFKRSFVSVAFLVELVTSWVPPTALAPLPLYIYTLTFFFQHFIDWLAGLDITCFPYLCFFSIIFVYETAQMLITNSNFQYEPFHSHQPRRRFNPK